MALIQEPDRVFVTNSNLYVTFIPNDDDFINVSLTDSNIYFTNDNLDVNILNTLLEVNNNTTFDNPDFVEITNSNLYITNEAIDVNLISDNTSSNIYFTNEAMDVHVLSYKTNDNFQVLNIDERHNYIYNYSEFGINQLRNRVTEINGATASNTIGDNFYLLSASNVNDKVFIESNELSPFEFGFETMVMIGHVQFTVPVGNNRIIIGMVDGDLIDGWFFEQNANGLELVRVANSVEKERTNQANFNIDNILDGTGPSGVTWNPVGPYIYAFKVLGQVTDVQAGFTSNVKGNYGFTPVHRFAPSAVLSDFNRYTSNPLTVILDNNGTANQQQAAQLLRITQIIGDFNFQKRITSIHRPGDIFKNITTGTFQPVISIRKKLNFNHIRIELEKMDILAENTMEIAIFFNSPLTAPVWGPIEETDNNETCLEYDYQATAMTISSVEGDGIIKVYSILATGGSNQSGRNTSTEDLESFRLTFGRNDTLTIAARHLGTAADVYINLRILELW